MKMNIHRAQELIVPLKNGKANDISPAWAARLIEALEYVIEHESRPTMRPADIAEGSALIDNAVENLASAGGVPADKLRQAANASR